MSAPEMVVSLNLPAGSVVAVGVGVASAVTGAGAGVDAAGAAQDDSARAAAAKVAMVRCFMVPPNRFVFCVVSIRGSRFVFLDPACE